MQEGDLIPLDGASEPSRAHSLEVIYTPGHTTDSITLYDPEVRDEMDVTFWQTAQVIQSQAVC